MVDTPSTIWFDASRSLPLSTGGCTTAFGVAPMTGMSR